MKSEDLGTIPILIFNKIGIKPALIKRDREGQSIQKKEKNNQDNMPTTDNYATKRQTTYFVKKTLILIK